MKTKMKTYTVDQDSVSALESRAYELEARKDIVKEMLESNMGTDTEAFAAYQKELVRYKAEFETAKAEFEKNVVKKLCPEAVSWELTYASCTLTCKVNVR